MRFRIWVLEFRGLGGPRGKEGTIRNNFLNGGLTKTETLLVAIVADRYFQTTFKWPICTTVLKCSPGPLDLGPSEQPLTLSPKYMAFDGQNQGM